MQVSESVVGLRTKFSEMGDVPEVRFECTFKSNSLLMLLISVKYRNLKT